jgi:hypothetical protein
MSSKKEPIKEHDYMKLLEAAKFLGVSKETLYRATSGYMVPPGLEGLPFVRFGKIIMFSKDKIIQFLDSKEELVQSKKETKPKQRRKK